MGAFVRGGGGGGGKGRRVALSVSFFISAIFIVMFRSVPRNHICLFLFLINKHVPFCSSSFYDN